MAEKLLFIDTNIWLDFYRARSDAGIKLLKHVEGFNQLIVTYQLEVEFKKNRQNVLKDSWINLKPPNEFGVPNIVADAQMTQMLKRHMKEAKQRVDALKKMIVRALESPASHDPVYQTAQRIFHRDDELVLTRKNNVRRLIRRKALRRFLQGYPPRKSGDTSMGDGFNWEWMIYCAAERGDSGEAERFFRREAERHSGMIPNTIGASRRWHLDCARSVRLRQEKSVRSAAKEGCR